MKHSFLLAVLALVGPACTGGQGQAPAGRSDRAGGGAAGPAAGRIAFARGTGLFVAGADGGGEREVAKDVPADRPFDWSPDGREIAFWRPAGADGDLCVVPMQAGAAPEPKKIATVNGVSCRSLAYSPDSSTIAFMGTSPAGVFLIGRDGTNLRRAAIDGQADQQPAWSPDGKHLVYGELVFVDESAVEKFRMELFVASAAAAPAQRLSAAEGATDSPMWSPAGGRVAYRGRRGQSFDVCTNDPQGGKEVNLTKTPEDEQDPTWSPDGRSIAFWRLVGRGAELWVMAADGTGARKLAAVKPDTKVGPPAWSPDGHAIAYGLSGADQGVWLAPLDAKDPKQVAKGEVRWVRWGR